MLCGRIQLCSESQAFRIRCKLINKQYKADHIIMKLLK